MNEDMVRCPKESGILYQREICETIFRKSDIRCWCKTCELFAEEKEQAESN